MMPEPQCNAVHDVPTRFERREKWRYMRGFNHLAEVIKGAKLKDGEQNIIFRCGSKFARRATFDNISKIY